MTKTLSAVVPDVNPVGVLDSIPASAWAPAIHAARDTLGVDLVVRHHDDPEPHFHFDITGEEDALPAVAPALSFLISKVLRAHVRTVDLPEGR